MSGQLSFPVLARPRRVKCDLFDGCLSSTVLACGPGGEQADLDYDGGEGRTHASDGLLRGWVHRGGQFLRSHGVGPGGGTFVRHCRSRSAVGWI